MSSNSFSNLFNDFSLSCDWDYSFLLFPNSTTVVSCFAKSYEGHYIVCSFFQEIDSWSSSRDYACMVLSSSKTCPVWSTLSSWIDFFFCWIKIISIGKCVRVKNPSFNLLDAEKCSWQTSPCQAITNWNLITLTLWPSDTSYFCSCLAFCTSWWIHWMQSP